MLIPALRLRRGYHSNLACGSVYARRSWVWPQVTNINLIFDSQSCTSTGIYKNDSWRHCRNTRISDTKSGQRAKMPVRTSTPFQRLPANIPLRWISFPFLRGPREKDFEIRSRHKAARSRDLASMPCSWRSTRMQPFSLPQSLQSVLGTACNRGRLEL